MKFKVQFVEAIETILYGCGDNPLFDIHAGIKSLLNWYEIEYKVDLDHKKFGFHELKENWREIRKKIMASHKEGETTMEKKQYKLGDTWKCECGKEHKLNDGYLAAHWNIELVHNCDCGRKHTVQSGFIELVEDQLKRHEAQKKS